MVNGGGCRLGANVQEDADGWLENWREGAEGKNEVGG
jgi:hypothetical protein